MIRLNVFVPDSSLRREMKVSKNMTINKLKKYLPNPNCNLIFGGSYLLEDQPLNFYSLSDGDFLIAVSKKSESIVFQKFSEDYDEFVHKMKSCINPKLANTAARLRDLRMQRIELYSKQPKISYEADSTELQIPTVIPSDDEDSPSVEPLPMLWDNKQNDQNNNNLC